MLVKLTEHPPPKRERISLINAVWQQVTKELDIDEYLETSVVCLTFILENLTVRAIDLFIMPTCRSTKSLSS